MFLLTSERKARAQRQANVNQSLSIELANSRAQCRAREDALREIIATVNGITTPNGTLRKVRRLALEGLAK